MASRKMKIKREHTSFSVPVTIISEEEARKRIMDALDQNKVGDTQPQNQDSGPAENNLESASSNPSNIRTFTGVAYSGEPIDRHYNFENLYLDIDGMTFKEQIPIFKNHDPNKVVGFGRPVKSGGKLLIEGVLATDLEGAKEIATLSDAGLEWELSVGVDPKFVQEISEGVEFSINGRQAVGPAMIFRGPDMAVAETSFVPIGADRNTSAQVFNKDLDKYKNIEVRNMDITTIKVDGKEVEVIKNKEGKFSISLELESLEEKTDYTFCACQGSTELDDEETEKRKKSLSDENAALLEEVAELRAKVKRHEKEKRSSRLSKAVETSSLSLSQEKFEDVVSLSDDAFELFVSSFENTKVTTESKSKEVSVDKALFKQDSPAKEFSDGLNNLDEAQKQVEICKAKARKLIAEYEAKGKSLNFSTAMGMVKV